MTNPLVTVGIPVYNGERYLGHALRSILDQTLGNLELVVSDNASSDRTEDICREFAQRDPRVRYIRQQTNIGAPRNWNAVVHAATGTFFKWASASDYCAPGMLEACVGALQKEPAAALCYGRTQFVDEDDRPLEVYAGDIAYDDERPSDRFARVGAHSGMNNAQNGVFRLDLLRRTRLDRPYPAGDLALMAEMALYGTFLMLPEVLIYRRRSRDTFTSMLSKEELEHVIDPLARSPFKLVVTRRHLDNLCSIARAPVAMSEKGRACRAALRIAAWDWPVIRREVGSLLWG